MWKLDEIVKARELAAIGHSSGEIAVVLRKPRKTILSFCWRNQIALPGATRDRKVRPLEMGRYKPPVTLPLSDGKKFRLPGIGEMRSCAPARPGGPGIDLLDRKAGQCAFILGEPRAQRCCGQPGRDSWCVDHLKVVNNHDARPSADPCRPHMPDMLRR